MLKDLLPLQLPALQLGYQCMLTNGTAHGATQALQQVSSAQGAQGSLDSARHTRAHQVKGLWPSQQTQLHRLKRRRKPWWSQISRLHDEP